MNSARIQENLTQVQQRIAGTAAQAGRERSEILLLAVSKTRPAEDILAAHQAGQVAFGENYVNEAIDKIEVLSDYPLEWHYIGGIQSNKTRLIAAHFSWVHTIASLKHAKRLDEQRPADLPRLNICIQVNISHETSKGGVPEDEVLPLAREIVRFSRLKLRGLMALPAPTGDVEKQRKNFGILRKLKEMLHTEGIALDTLSMGMSADMEAAIAEGATIVRVGTAIFGPRT
ncbi:MAG: YggS family pyridoxal phosphate-dependent enzyme [Pseudomonadota bacterium]